jgi:pimeloyl-ACP methyl ester carboxylesterase
MVLKKSNLKRVLMTVIIVLLIFSVLNFIATKLIYDSIFSRYDCDKAAPPEPLRETVETRETIFFDSGENTLCGYLYRCRSENTKDTLIILASGHNACSESYLWQIKELLNLGWSVFAFDSTGYCNSQGESAVGFSQELLDLKGALDYIEARDRLGYENIALLGHSRGGYAVCCALSYDYDISAVVSVSGINSPMEGVIGAAGTYVGDFAYLNYGFLWLYQTMLFGNETVNLKANEVLQNSDTPVLIVHGAEDETVPADKYSVYSYKDTIEGENVQYLLRLSPDSSGHTDILFDEDSSANDSLIAKINDFLESTIK